MFSLIVKYAFPPGLLQPEELLIQARKSTRFARNVFLIAQRQPKYLDGIRASSCIRHGVDGALSFPENASFTYEPQPISNRPAASGFHIVRGNVDPAEHRFRSERIGVVEMGRGLCYPRIDLYPPRMALARTASANRLAVSGFLYRAGRGRPGRHPF